MAGRSTQSPKADDGATAIGRLRTALGSAEAAAIAGVFAAGGWIYVLSFFLGGPRVGATENDIAAFFSDRGSTAGTNFSLQVLVFSTIAFLYFIGVIRNRIRGEGHKLFDSVFMGGGVLVAALLFVGVAALAAPFVQAAQGGVDVDPAAAALTRSHAAVIIGQFTTRIAAMFVFATSTLGLRTQVLPKWLTIAGYGVGAALLFNVIFFTPTIYIFPGYIAVASIVLLFRRHPITSD